MNIIKFNKLICKRLEKLRIKHNYSLNAVKRGTGIHQNIIKMIKDNTKTGKYVPNVNTIYKLCKFYKYPMYKLFKPKKEKK